jgi:hypothetical protein
LEPNPILIQYLYEKRLGVGCIKDEWITLGHPMFSLGEFGLIAANMVVNHLSTDRYTQMVEDMFGALTQDGLVVYTAPNPERKAAKHNLNPDDNDAVAEEEAPWGGLVRYFHRSLGYQIWAMQRAGFDVAVLAGGWNDTHHQHEGPKRIMCIGAKGQSAKVVHNLQYEYFKEEILVVYPPDTS